MKISSGKYFEWERGVYLADEDCSYDPGNITGKHTQIFQLGVHVSDEMKARILDSIGCIPQETVMIDPLGNKITFASRDKAEMLVEAVYKVVLSIAPIHTRKAKWESWAKNVWISDESSFWDFMPDESDLERISKELGFTVTKPMKIIEAAQKLADKAIQESTCQPNQM